MAKPTLLQKALRRPSQRYATTSTSTATATLTTTNRTAMATVSSTNRVRDFHSTRNELLRIAAELAHEDPQHDEPERRTDDDHDEGNNGELSNDSSNEEDHKAQSPTPKEDELFTLDSVIAHSTNIRSTNVERVIENTSHEQPAFPVLPPNKGPVPGEEGEDDVFYTPAPSPIRSSPSSGSPVPVYVDSPPRSRTHTPSPPSSSPNSVSASASSSTASLPANIDLYSITTSERTTTVAISAMAPLATLSTSTSHVSTLRSPPHPKRAQVPHARKTTYTDEDWAKDVRWLVAPSKSSTSVKSKGKDKKKTGTPSISVRSATTTTSVSMSSPTPTPSAISRSAPSSPASSQQSLAVHNLSPVPAPTPTSSTRPHPRSRIPKAKAASKSARTLVGMTVLLEVEEDPDADVSDPGPLDSVSLRANSVRGSVDHRRSQSLSHPSSHIFRKRPDSTSGIPRSVGVTPAPRVARRRSLSFPSSSASPSRANSLPRSQKSVSPSRPFRPPSRAPSSSSGPSNTKYSSISRISSPLTSANVTTRSPYTTAPMSVLDALAAHPHLDGASEEDALPSSGTRGFTGLVLPRAGSGSRSNSTTGGSWKWWKGKGGKSSGRGADGALSVGLSVGLGLGDEVDLTRAGLAQTTMASVEVVRGIAAATSYSSSMGFRAGSSSLSDTGKRGSLFGTGWFSKDRSKKNGKSKGNDKSNRNSMAGPNPTLVRSGSKKGRGDDETPLGFTSYRAPPVYVGAGAVLVQVWAVGLDGVDGRLVGVQMDSGGADTFSSRDSGSWIDRTDGSKARDKDKDKDKEKTKPAPVGYVPGRSFVGRVLEVGWEVREETARKGDWVVGLLGVGKCGALAEFILVDRHRVHRIPHPVMSPTIQSPSTPSLAANPRHSSSPGAGQEAKQRISSMFLPDNEDIGYGVQPKPNQSGLTVEELALLPLCGVPAYRAVRTLETITRAMAKPVSSSASSSTMRPRSMVYEYPRRPEIARSPLGRESSEEDSETENASDQVHHHVQGDPPHPYGVGVNGYKQRDNTTETRPRVLILRAHDGSGALAVQMLVKAGWSVWTHVPVPFELPGPPPPLAKGNQCDDGDDSEGAEESKVPNGENEKELERRRGILKRIEDRLRGWGAEQVLFVPAISFPSLPRSSSSSVPGLRASSSSFASLRHPFSSSSSFTYSPNPSPSLFSRSSSGSSSPISSPYSHAFSSSNGPLSSNSHPSSSIHQHILPRPYTFTALPLSPYTSEQASAGALLCYLAQLHVRFDAVIDTIGGREVWEAGKVLLSLPVRERDDSGGDGNDRGRDGLEAQFTTLVGDTPERIIPTAGDHFRAGVRSLRGGGGGSKTEIGHVQWADTDEVISLPSDKSKEKGKKARKSRMKARQVNYAWVSIVSDVDWEGNDVCESLGAALRQATQEGVKPYVGLSDFFVVSSKGKGRAIYDGIGEDGTVKKVVPFERTPAVFVPGGGLEHGGTIVSKIV